MVVQVLSDNERYKLDGSDDALFYSDPRFVQHLDEAFRDRLTELGFEVEGEEFERAFKRFKDLADAKKVIYNEDLEAIVADSVQTVDDRYGFGGLALSCGSDGPPRAQVALTLDGEEVEKEASGVGPVDAIFRAISDLTGTASDLIQYQVHAVTSGLDAQGEVSVTIEEKVVGEQGVG